MATFKNPTREQVKEALRRIPTIQLRRAFFEGLKNPLWVEPLFSEGAFDSPPEPETTDDGLVRDVYWPEMDYLVRSARDVPQQVVNVLLKLSASTNADVKRGVFEIGGIVSPDQAARLEPLIKVWVPMGIGWRTDPRHVVTYGVNLLSSGTSRAGKRIVNAIFKPSDASDRKQPSFVLDDFWYEHELPRVVEALDSEGLNLALPWLVAWERRTGHFSDKSDISYFARESIRVRGDGSFDGVEQALIDAVRDLSIKAMAVNVEAATKSLLGSKMLLARKIAMFALGEVLQQESDEDLRCRMLNVAHSLLFDDASCEDSCRIDYAELARSAARTTGEPLEQLTQVFEPGPRESKEQLREWLKNDAADDDDLEVRVRDYQNRWKHRWLSAIGFEALPLPLRDQLARLDGEFGVINEPLRPSIRITSWVGPNSPITRDEMAAMSPIELITHLESWHVSGNRWGPEPSHQGQGRELSSLLTTNPKAVAGVTDLARRLRPTYLSAIFSGWDAAVRADLELDWAQAADTIEEVLLHDDASTFPPEGSSFDDDPDMRSSKDAAVGLLGKLVRRRTLNAIPDEIMLRFADLLITTAADEIALDEYNGLESESGMDPLTTSLNWQWPVRLRGLVHLLSWGGTATWHEAARSALEKELSYVDARGASGAVVGESIGRLLDAAPEWVTPRISQFFGAGANSSTQQQIALTTAMATHRYHPILFELLTPSMIAAINSGRPIDEGWSGNSNPLQRIGEWAIDAIICGHTSIDGPVPRAFFTAAPPQVRGGAIGHIAWTFMHASAVDDSIRDGLALLWDQRVAHIRTNPEDAQELSGFHWFVRSHKFAADWWLPRMKEAIELYPGMTSEQFMIGKDIASAADIDPRGALDVLKLLLKGRDANGVGTFDLTKNAIPMVIARSISYGDHDLSTEATTYMNSLGEMGHLTLRAEVNKLINGEVTQPI
jgi:hypothetical protein